ncbi:Bifunctional oligoribonuclease and PAP phosphatase NrnA [Flavobacterium columnare]|uniref:Bifunctional oligoribonuclease and PAP phosphatase NrnA n=2 Tax=Flavobacterium TaxID=237 RepID=A0A2N9PDA5_9FLAO|nr:bifunctional oligoribonuclease/PAP phosphatase NrnA [Flavobacterium columnare]RVU89918.1 bifunctional oligoribonuclease/PAP phosphatase NrnA [Flavobacterium columnare]SPE78325.1 Bifunctional oligoribonuclease and PAP phosphatase NrnA [Flavobacterium columnare]
MMNANEIIAVKDLLATPKNITIIPHRNPDGDAMGSTLGLYHFLKKLGHKATVIAPNDFPSFLAWLPSSEQVLIYEKDSLRSQKELNSSDLIFTLDFNALHRTGDLMESFLSTLDKTFIMIDHHQLPDSYALYQYSDTSMSSTCEMIYHFIHFIGYEKLIDTTIATCIYTGLVTDTGSFRFSSTTSTTHKVAADLIKKGIKNAEIHNNLFDTSSYDRLQLLGKALQNMQLMENHKTSYITLSQEELNHFSHQKGDTEGFVNYGLSIKGIDFTAIFIENKEEGIIKISFRSQGSFDVNQFARNYFNGGGHLNAAGGKSTLSLEETVNKFISIVKDTRK